MTNKKAITTLGVMLNPKMSIKLVSKKAVSPWLVFVYEYASDNKIGFPVSWNVVSRPNWSLTCLVSFFSHFSILLLKSIHWVNSSARSSFFEKHIILTKPFQPARADISCSFFEKHIIVQNFLLSEWALVLFWILLRNEVYCTHFSNFQKRSHFFSSFS